MKRLVKIGSCVHGAAGLIALHATSVLADIRYGPEPEPPTETDVSNALVGSVMLYWIMIIAGLAVGWILLWGMRKMRENRSPR